MGVGRYLDHDELVELTDRTYAKYQIAWLTANAYQFEVGASGHPKVLRSYSDARGGVKTTKRRGPRLDGLAAA